MQDISGISCLPLHTKNMEKYGGMQGYIYPQTWENGLHNSKVISTNLSSILFIIKGIGEIGRSIPKGWSTYEVANASQTTCLPGRKVNRKCTSPTHWQDRKSTRCKRICTRNLLRHRGSLWQYPTTAVATALEDWKIHRSVKNWITTLIGRKQVCVKAAYTALLQPLAEVCLRAGDCHQHCGQQSRTVSWNGSASRVSLHKDTLTME